MASRQANQHGFHLIEVVLAVSIFSIILSTIVGTFLYGQDSARVAVKEAKAAYLAQEGVAAARNIRDSNFANLTTGSHGIVLSPNQWVFSGTSDTLDGFTRQVTLTDVDTNTKNAQVQITWEKGGGRSGRVVLSTLFTNWQTATGGYWESIHEESFEDVPGSQDALKVQTVGDYAYIITNENNSEFTVLSIANPANPSYVSALNLGGSGLGNIAVLGNYAYLPTQNNAKELQIVNVSNPNNPNPSGTYNASGTADGLGIFVSGTRAYLIRQLSSDPELYIINVTNPDSPTLLGSLNLSAEPTDIYVLGNYAYVSSKDDAGELQVIDVSNPSAPELEEEVNLPGASDGLSVMGSGSTLGVGSSDDKVYFYDIGGDPEEPTLSSSLLLGGDVVDITFGVSAINSRTYAFLAVNNANAEIRVVDVTTLAAATIDGTFNEIDVINGVAYSVSKDRVIGVGNSNNKEFVISAP